MTAGTMRKKFEQAANAAKLAEMATGVVMSDAELLESLLREQINAGQDGDGNDLAPSYLDDPYFKTQEQAVAYASWKWRLAKDFGIGQGGGIYPARKFATPNLNINGYWQSHIRLQAEQGGVFSNSVGFSSGIESRYNKPMRLNRTGLRYYADNYFRRKFQTNINNLILN
jgi:hypothetical protein